MGTLNASTTEVLNIDIPIPHHSPVLQTTLKTLFLSILSWDFLESFPCFKAYIFSQTTDPFLLFFSIYFYLFIWLCRVLVVARRIFDLYLQNMHS